MRASGAAAATAVAVLSLMPIPAAPGAPNYMVAVPMAGTTASIPSGDGEHNAGPLRCWLPAAGSTADVQARTSRCDCPCDAVAMAGDSAADMTGRVHAGMAGSATSSTACEPVSLLGTDGSDGGATNEDVGAHNRAARAG